MGIIDPFFIKFEDFIKIEVTYDIFQYIIIIFVIINKTGQNLVNLYTKSLKRLKVESKAIGVLKVHFLKF